MSIADDAAARANSRLVQGRQPKQIHAREYRKNQRLAGTGSRPGRHRQPARCDRWFSPGHLLKIGNQLAEKTVGQSQWSDEATRRDSTLPRTWSAERPCLPRKVLGIDPNSKRAGSIRSALRSRFDRTTYVRGFGPWSDDRRSDRENCEPSDGAEITRGESAQFAFQNLIFVAVVRPSRPRPSEPVARANPRVPQKMAPRTEGLVAGPSLCVGWVHPPRTHECFRLIRAVSRPRQKEPRQQGRRGQVRCGVRVHPPPAPAA